MRDKEREHLREISMNLIFNLTQRSWVELLKIIKDFNGLEMRSQKSKVRYKLLRDTIKTLLKANLMRFPRHRLMFVAEAQTIFKNLKMR